MSKPVATKKKKKVQGGKKGAPAKPLTRKEQRKQKVQQKKETKRMFFSAGKLKGPICVANTIKGNETTKPNDKVAKKKKKKITPEQWMNGVVASDDDESVDSDFSDHEVDARMPKQKKPGQSHQNDSGGPVKKKQTTPALDATEIHRREKQRQKQLEAASRKQRVKQLRRDNEEEERMIGRLEKKLRLNKKKDKNRSVRKMFDDGLDYALELCLDDDEERERRELKAKRKQDEQRKAEAGDDFSGDEFGSEDDDGVSFNEAEKSGTDDEVEHGDNTEDDTDNDGEEQKDDEDNGEQLKEDIYGRKRDKDGNIITTNADNSCTPDQKYIPPHQRALLAAQGGDATKQRQLMEHLRRNCKGLLNRLSEANLHKICTGIEELYMKNSRNNTNETMTTLLNEALISRSMTKERMVQEHIVLLSYLHAHVGSEIGAHFLQTFIQQFVDFCTADEVADLAVDDKRLNNVVLVLSYMYIFKIYEHRLLLQIIDRLADNLCEKTIECLLLIFQTVGFKLRKDDPLAFKQMMLSVQQKIAAAPLEMKENLRLKFMVDILGAVKNNNINKMPHFDPELGEQLRKQLKAMLRNDKYVVTLNITIEDLLRADHVGKWWIVGSAWSGNINDVGAATGAGGATGKSNDKSKQRFSEKLLQLAKQQKMNTDERRNIFCIIMSAEDYVDAFEKILHLSLKDQRTIAYVIVHCSLNEKRSNPYYAHLALKFCHYERKFQLAFQYASWDRINDIETLLTKQQIKNLAKFMEQLILNGGLILSVLKVVNFLQLNKMSFFFMKEIMLGLLLATDEQAVKQAFERVAKNSKLQQFKNSVRLFMQHFLLRNGDGCNNDEGDELVSTRVKLNLNEEQLALLKRRIEYADTLLAYVDL